MSRVVLIGGGAAGMMAAVSAAEVVTDVICSEPSPLSEQERSVLPTANSASKPAAVRRVVKCFMESLLLVNL